MNESIQTRTVRLHNGVTMPQLGFGVWRVEEGKEVYEAVTTAIDTGYRAIDTAAVYGNEEGVGKAIADSEVPREELFVTTKVWNTDQGYEETLQAFENSREKLGLKYLDLYLIHWPVKGKYKDTWKALEKLYSDGKVRAIGVSNFQVHHLQDLLADAKEKPAVNQVEYHPYLTQKELLHFCQEQQIQLEAWSPLMQGNVAKDTTIQGLANKYGKTPAQIVLRWDLQHGVITIPKSVTPSRIRENIEIFDFSLEPSDMETLDNLNQDRRFGPDPDHFSF